MSVLIVVFNLLNYCQNVLKNILLLCILFYFQVKIANFEVEFFSLTIMKRVFLLLLGVVCVVSGAQSETKEDVAYGDFEQWITRTIKESAVIGGKHKTLYEIGPTQKIDGNKAYTNLGGSPWATCNVYAKVAGVVKGSNAVFPDMRSGSNKCVKLSTIMEKVKALGIINMDVLVSGSIYLGTMVEPVSSTKNPYSKLDMNTKFTKRPKYLSFDYKVVVPPNGQMIYSSGFGKKKVLKGRQNACETFVLLQRRWEDADGNVYAKRVGTGRERYTKSTNGWVNGHRMRIYYGNIVGQPYYKDYMNLISPERPYYTRNSKGKLVPVQEVGWDSPLAKPTHIIMMFSAGCGTAYEGTLGQTMWVDNVSFIYD